MKKPGLIFNLAVLLSVFLFDAIAPCDELTVKLRHSDPVIPNVFENSPAKSISVFINDKYYLTDDDGVILALDEASAIIARLSGAYVNVMNKGKQPDVFLANPVQDTGDVIIDGGNDESLRAQIDAFSFAILAREHALKYEGNSNYFGRPLLIFANAETENPEQECSSWIDNGYIFISGACDDCEKPCNNPASTADIVLREIGRYIYNNRYLNIGSPMNEDLAEGFALAFVSSVTLSPVIGAGLFKDGSLLYNLEEHHEWMGSDLDGTHVSGPAIAAAFWDMRDKLIRKYGNEKGNENADKILYESMINAISYDSLYHSVLKANDDNGNINDLTPDYYIIYEAFYKHGLVPRDGASVIIGHNQLERMPQSLSSFPIEAHLSRAPGYTVEPGPMSLVFSTDKGKSWTSVLMTHKSNGYYTADMPPAAEGSYLFYRIETLDPLTGEIITEPPNKAEPFYRVYIGQLTEITCYDFETETDVWTHGSGDWVKGVPSGKGNDPQNAYSGDNIWGTDLGNTMSAKNGAYSPNTFSYLESPPFDLSYYKNVRLRFRRHLSVEDGLYDQASIFANGKKIWTNATGADHIDSKWILFDIDISDLASQKDTVVIRWELKSDHTNELGGWNIDEVCLAVMENPEQESDINFFSSCAYKINNNSKAKSKNLFINLMELFL